MITREQHADLRPGDVVELRSSEWHPEAVLQSPVRHDLGCVQIGPFTLSWPDGTVASELFRHATLTVVSRAPRPLYVNHPRTEPVLGDVVRTSSGFVYSYTTTPRWVGTRECGCETPWRSTRHGGYDSGPIYDKGLRLLVDGETGQVVP